MPLDSIREKAGKDDKYYFSESDHTKAIQSVTNLVYDLSKKDILYGLFILHNAYFSLLHNTMEQYGKFLANKFFKAEDMFA